MENLSNEIKRKIRIRKFAMDNMGTNVNTDCDVENVINVSDNEIERLFTLLNNSILDADQSRIQNGYSAIISKRKFGKIIVFIKKAFRKILHRLLGWYIKPILDKQTFFNGKVVNSIGMIRDILKLKEQEVILLQGELTKKTEEIELLKSKLNEISQEVAKMELYKIELNEISQKIDYVLKILNVTCDIKLLEQTEFDYFKFEDIVRGSRTSIKELQSAYISYFKANNGGKVLDIGCGRGEFLELMWENEIEAYGVELYDPFVDYCRTRGFDVRNIDALTHLHSLEDCTLGGIFMSQVIEHLPTDYIIALINTAYKKLKPGCYFILETPNPDCLAAISEFNIDMSHIKPIHYKSLEYLFKEANFTSVKKHHTEHSLYPLRAKHLSSQYVDNLEEFNQGIDYINNLLFGYRDFTLIAQK